MTSIVVLDKKLILKELGLNRLAKVQQDAIWQLILDIFQTRVLDYILSALSNEDSKRRFLLLLNTGNYSQMVSFLRSQIEDIDRQLAAIIEQIKTDLKMEVAAAQEEG